MAALCAVAAAASAVAPACGDSGSSPASGSDASATAGLGRASLGDTPLPCAVQRVLRTSCQGCHGREPGLQAPMALVTHEDLTAPSAFDPERSVYEVMVQRIHDPDSPMPPAGSRRLTEAELAILDAFAEDGAPAGDEACDGEPDGGAGSPPDDTGECYRLLAHDREQPGDTTPYLAPSGEYYSCFYFDPPWPAGAQAISVRSLDTPRVHHWMLYYTAERYEPGEIRREVPDCGYGARAALGVHSRGEADGEQRMPDEVGLELPAPGQGLGLLLEIHYNNTGEPAEDSAGVEVCTPDVARPNTAGLAALGAALFMLPPGRETSVSSTCTPQFDGDIHVFRSLPHMHALGVAMRTEIERADGGTDVLLDVGFDVNNQIAYDTPAVIHPGDRLVTTCTYHNTRDRNVFAGYGVEDEMCNHFIYAWPAGAISNGTIGGVPALCLQ